MSEWHKSSLRDVSESIQYGYTESAVAEPVGPKLLRITDIVPYFIDWGTVPFCRIDSENYDKYKLQIGDIVIARTGATTGYNALITKDIEAVFASYLIRFKINPKKADCHFIGHLLKSSGYYGFINCAIGGAAQPGINAKVLSSFIFMLPPLATQTRIAEILSAYDDAIENNNRRIALLEKAARELYKEWFVRFRFPGYENAKFVNGLPEGWETVPLGSLVNITSSKRSYDNDRVTVGIPLYRSKEIIQIENGEAITEPLFISEEWYSMIRDKFGVPQENDILITSRGTIGIPFLVDKRVFYFSDGNLTWLQSGKNPEIALYLYLWLNSPTGQAAVLSATIGTSQKALPIEALKKLKVAQPDNIVLSAFYEKAMPLVELKRNLHNQSQNLARQRDLLLPRLMSGKMEV